uniref:Uncharacterized protein n=1 Tax=Glossina pallidipes TaxID=7398 RepID=A0A1B0A2Q4_GLOPL
MRTLQMISLKYSKLLRHKNTAFGATLICSDKLASCRPEGSPEATKTGKPAAKTIRTTQRIGDTFATEKLKFTSNTKKITTEPNRVTDMDQQQIERFLREELPKSRSCNGSEQNGNPGVDDIKVPVGAMKIHHSFKAKS